MNIALVGNILTKQIDAIVGLDSDGNFGYISINSLLDEILDIIVGFDSIEIEDIEYVDNKEIIINKPYYTNNFKYLLALNYKLCHPWKIVTIKGLDTNQDLAAALKESYNLLEGYYEN